MMKQYGLARNEKLKSRKSIDEVFTTGRSVACFPLRVKYVVLPLAEGAAPVQLGVTVSKKLFKKAVDRNRIKRLIREAYRLQKEALTSVLSANNLSAHLFFIYTDKELQQYDAVYKAVANCLQMVQQKIGVKK